MGRHPVISANFGVGGGAENAARAGAAAAAGGARTGRTASGSARPGQSRAALELVDEVMQMAQLLHQMEQRIGADTGTTAAERRVLFGIFTRGPGSVPELARAQAVTRQSVQQTMNHLLELELVERSSNPEHAGSPLFRLTAAGQRLVGGMLRRESRLYRAAARGIGARRLAGTRRTIREFREYVERAAERLP